MLPPSYDYLTRHIVPGPRSIPYFVPFVILPLSLLIPRSVLSRWQSIAIFMPIITLCTIQAWRDMHGVDVISVNGLLWSAFVIAFRDPWQDFRLVSYRSQQGSNSGKDTPTASVIEEGYPDSMTQRIVWVGRLLGSIKLDNWKIKHKSHDRRQPARAGFKDETQYLQQACLGFLFGCAVLDTTRAYIDTDPYFTDMTMSISSALPFGAPSHVLPRVFRSMIIGAQAWALIGQMAYAPAVVPVILSAFGLIPTRLSPHSWPSFFGPPAAIFKYGVRGFWGTFWHQTMRWTTTGPGYAVADSLGLAHTSLLRYAILSISAFGLSGVVHMGLVPPEPVYATVDVGVIRHNMAGFFWLQAVAVTLEALVGRVMVAMAGAETWHRGAGMRTRMIVNCIWTIAWFSFCIPALGDAARQLGYWRVWPLPVSLIRPLQGKDWVTWR